MRVWSAPVRYAECDQQGVVFNAHYLTYADEAMTAWTGSAYDTLLARELDTQLKSSTLTWDRAATWGDTISADVRLTHLGTTSFALVIELTVGARQCCVVETTYVIVDAEGRPAPIPADVRTIWQNELDDEDDDLDDLDDDEDEDEDDLTDDEDDDDIEIVDLDDD